MSRYLNSIDITWSDGSVGNGDFRDDLSSPPSTKNRYKDRVGHIWTLSVSVPGNKVGTDVNTTFPS